MQLLSATHNWIQKTFKSYLSEKARKNDSFLESRMSRPSRFMSRSMTPSSSVKMSTSKFNLVCGRPREIACSPNVSRVPNPQPPKPVDARVTTPSMSRREFGRSTDSASVLRRERSMSREARAPVPPSRDSSFYLPFGSYADIASHTKPPTR